MALKNVFLLLVLTCLMTYTTAARNHDLKNIKPGQNLAARLDANAGRITECWKQLVQLESCSAELVEFFITGLISSECCRAVDVITHKCWPSNLTSLGFTPQESNILSGYCDVSASPVAAPPLPSSDSPISS